MSIVINEKESYIIDRTLIDVTQKCLDINGLQRFAANLKRLGVDFFEIDERTFYQVKTLTELGPYIFIIDNIDQLKICSENGIEYIIVKEETLEFIKLEDIQKFYNFNIILEIDVNLWGSGFIEKISNNIDLNKVYCLSFKGESSCIFDNYRQEDLSIKINMYASDKLFMATAVGFEAILMGFDYVTTAFCGKDGTYGTTTLEEIITFLTVIIGAQVGGEICLLAQIANQYEKLTSSQIPKNMPIIGRYIFKYESGVHVAGIEKNPITYEPFKPELVGTKRKLVLGKHSGKNSILAKLKELNIDSKFTVDEIIMILNQVKYKSVLNKKEISDKDFIEICRGSVR